MFREKVEVFNIFRNLKCEVIMVFRYESFQFSEKTKEQ